MYNKIFSRGKINGVELKNRVTMGPMDESLGDNSGNVSPRCMEYFLARAKGGTAALVTSYVAVCPPELGGIAMPGQLRLLNIGNQLSMAHFAERVHAYGAKLFVQLHHPGRKTTAEYNDGYQPVSCSAITPSMPKDTVPCRELTVDEIKEIERYFVKGARFAMWAGADGIQIHCAHGYLLNQFLNPAQNARTDEYGGSMENRCRIVVEIVKGIREVVGPKFPITVRLNAFEGEGLPGEADADEMRRIGKYFSQNGIDGIHLTMTSIDRVGTPDMKAGWRNQIYAYFKEVVDTIPVYGPNEVKTPEEGEKVLESGCQDFLVLARQQIADPEWVNKAREGRSEDIRPCISCNTCMQQITIDHQPLRCSVNPLAGREIDNQFLPKGEGLVVIIGAGPGGMQAALTASERGFKVILIEKEKELGGALQLANKAPDKFRIDNLIRYFKGQIEKDPNIEVWLNYEVTEEKLDELAALKPYAVVSAVGGRQVVPNIPGVSLAVMANDVLSGKREIRNKKAVVVGGGMTGLETAEYLAARGNSVKVLEMLPAPGRGIFNFNVTKTVNALEKQRTEIYTCTRADSISKEAVTVTDTRSGRSEEIPCDVVVLAIGVYTDHSMRDMLEKRFFNVTEIGDANKAGKIMTAVRDGYDRIKVL
ncbi:MAG TPA: NAD(P)/FAD-dependent oxidoreductase [Candidatus Blautia merdipullorum]|nr:NAD(P)/FAD-dependent oxidoreductase [Candidatus Blautia merdipullorum]